MAEQNSSTVVEKYDVFSGDLGNRLWDVLALIEAALAAGMEQNDTVDRVLRVAEDKLGEVIKDVDNSQFLYTTKDKTISTVEPTVTQVPAFCDDKRRLIEDSFIRIGNLFDMTLKEIDVHQSCLDSVDALVHAARNEVTDLENKVFPESQN